MRSFIVRSNSRGRRDIQKLQCPRLSMDHLQRARQGRVQRTCHEIVISNRCSVKVQEQTHVQYGVMRRICNTFLPQKALQLLNRSFYLSDVTTPDGELIVTIWDRAHKEEIFLGMIRLRPSRVEGKAIDNWYRLIPRQWKEKVRGEVRVEMTFTGSVVSQSPEILMTFLTQLSNFSKKVQIHQALIFSRSLAEAASERSYKCARKTLNRYTQ